MRLRRRRELVEVEWLVHLREIVVEQRTVGPSGEFAEFLAQSEIARQLTVGGIGDQRDQRTRFSEPRARVGNIVDVEPEDLPRHPAHVAAGKRVVADERDTSWRELPRDDCEQRGAHLLGDPRVHAVGDDVIKRCRRGREIPQIQLLQREVGQAQRGRQLPSGGDRLRGEVATDERRSRQRSRHRNEVAAAATSDLEHSARRDRRCRHPGQRGNRREPVGVRGRVRVGCVTDLVVRGWGGGNSGSGHVHWNGSGRNARL